MAQHFQYINKLKGKIAASSLRLEDPADRSLVLEMAIKCADLNNPSKPTEQCTKWAYSVMQEFFVQVISLVVKLFIHNAYTPSPLTG